MNGDDDLEGDLDSGDLDGGGGDVLGSGPRPARSRRTVRTLWIVGLAVAALVIGLSVNSRYGNGNHRAEAAPGPTATSSSPEPPPIRIDADRAPAVTAWYAGGGKQAVSVLSVDSDRIAVDHIRQDFNALGSDCSQLSRDVAAAQAYLPLPDAGAQDSWAAALGHLELGADGCVDGVTHSLSSQLSAASSEMYTGTMTLLSLQSQLDKINRAAVAH
ncbi:hypothetical protein ACEZCY_02370 [Streptacidiphilus sp. N1-12]|uniref:Uncharacterized protein n=2 Tax=Streptacidiphilus alkalitolerans TaxID=3342712 RepID=A0ABV6W7P6_9ACTN